MGRLRGPSSTTHGKVLLPGGSRSAGCIEKRFVDAGETTSVCFLFAENYKNSLNWLQRETRNAFHSDERATAAQRSTLEIVLFFLQ
jgi:hypothetical protein